MRTAALLLAVINLVITSCGQKNKNEDTNREVKTTTITLSEEVEAPDPPPPPAPGTSASSKLSTSWHSVREWLTAITKEKAPSLAIDSYNIGLFESKDDYTLLLTGENTYQKTANHTVRQLDFKPKHMYFELPKKEYGRLSSDQLKEQITRELDDFIKTPQFKQSFLSKGKQIKTDWNGVVWKI